jgi:hypothetical protein
VAINISPLRGFPKPRGFTLAAMIDKPWRAAMFRAVRYSAPIFLNRRKADLMV